MEHFMIGTAISVICLARNIKLFLIAWGIQIVGRSGGRGGYDHYGADYRYGYIPHDFGYGNVYTGGYTGGYGIDNSARYNRGTLDI